ncbi:MAG: hypothetical protein ACUVSC_13890, partial [Candidatus Fervidibacter sp.]|uniref:hypothetical protein n=1 Tax=Candidatus Fervidibacter sp. TaxID=3100871 RepID=UPI00404998B7
MRRWHVLWDGLGKTILARRGLRCEAVSGRGAAPASGVGPYSQLPSVRLCRTALQGDRGGRCERG